VYHSAWLIGLFSSGTFLFQKKSLAN
jgi:hypothetical protein